MRYLISLILLGFSFPGNMSAADSTSPLLVIASNETQAENSKAHRNVYKNYDLNNTDSALAAEIYAYFDAGYKYFSKEKYFDATLAFYKFIENSTPNEDDYEWAQFFFGVGLYHAGFSHASVDILANLVIRKPHPQIVTYCLELFKEIMRSQPFDNDLLINRVLCDQQYSFIEGDIADFVNYYQGLYAWQNGFWKWGDEHFAKIKPRTHYHNSYLFQKALLMVQQNHIDSAISILRPILTDQDESDQLLDNVRKTLARLLYEKGEYAEADRLYWQIQEDILGQSGNLMERAWAHYRMGNAERAMGLLYAFEAPNFKNAFTPEYYILKSFIYKDVCHFQRAMDMVAEFNLRYGRTLKKIYQRKGVRDNKNLLAVILNKKSVEQILNFIELLETEQRHLDKLSDSPRLYNYLETIYELKLAQSKSRLRKLVAQEYEKLANEMLEYEEEAHLMEYEIGLNMYQRVSQVHYDDQNNTSEKQTDVEELSIYPFQGEFWNDELADYRVVLPNKCDSVEEWDIFFK